MIQCNSISKTYDNPIFQHFSYHFEETGFYVLYGASGSGKTTLLQILLGITPFEGSILYGNKEYRNQVVFDEVQEQIAYISQDNYFIDYLTMEENIKLETKKEKKFIVNTAKLLKIENLLDKLPNQLSGGEKQRFAILGNLLKDKKIFLMDEPTSSLDQNNKKIIFEIIHKLKDKVLVICATHDEMVFEYTNNIIDFNHLEQYQMIKENHSTFPLGKQHFFSISSCFLLFQSLWQQVKRNSKKVSFLYILIFTLSLLLCFACTDFQSKLFSSLVNVYHTNAIQIDCSIDTENYCQDILSQYDVSEVVYHYVRNIPTSEGVDGSIVKDDFNYELKILSLPTKEKDLYQIQDKLLYGTYFSNQNQIIVGYQEALELAEKYHVELDKLIGRTEVFILPDGEDTFEIVGILKPLDQETAYYFQSILGIYTFDNYYYVNGSYLKKYLYDDILGEQELNPGTRSTALTVFFKNKYSFLDFYRNYENKNLQDDSIRIYNPVSNFVEYELNMETVKIICFSISVTFLILAMIFYLQIHKTQNTYTDHYYCIYQYYGYSHREIKYASIGYFVTYIIFLLILSVACSSILSMIINQIVVWKHLLPFPIFVVDGKWICFLMLILGFVAMLEGIYLNYIRKKDGWYQMLKEKSDLL